MRLKSLRLSSVLRRIALEVQDIRELGLGWAWFMNDLRAFLPAWQEMELASPSQDEPVTQIEADVPIEPLALQADATNLDLELQVYEGPLAITPFGVPEVVPDWQDTHAMHAFLGDRCQCLGQWIRTSHVSGSWQKRSYKRTGGSTHH